MRVLLLPSLLCLFCLNAQSQSKLNIAFINKEVSYCLSENYIPNQDSLSKTCRIGWVFIRFSVSRQGKIQGLDFSKGSPVFITDALKKAIYKLEENKRFVSTLKGKGVTILKPFNYNYQAGCNYPKPADSLSKDEWCDRYIKILSNLESSNDLFMNMLNFTSGKAAGIYCVILSPHAVAESVE